MKKNGVNSSTNAGGNNSIGALLNMLMPKNNNNNTKSDNNKNVDNDKLKNEQVVKNDFPAVPLGYQYAKLIEKHDALSKKIDLQNRDSKNNG